MTPSYGYLINYRTGTVGSLRLNDVPILRTRGGIAGAVTSMGMLDAFLAPGENVLTIEIEAAPLESGCLDLKVLSDNQDDPLAHFVWPDMALGTLEGQRRPPFVHELRFHPEGWTNEPVYRRARASVFDCHGTPEQHALVRRFHEALTRSDYPGYLALMRFRTEAIYTARGNEPEFEPSVIERQSGDFFARQIHVRPLEMSELHFESCAGGKACHVRRIDGGPAIQAFALSQWAIDHPEAYTSEHMAPPTEADQNMSISSDLTLVLHDDQWKIFR